MTSAPSAPRWSRRISLEDFAAAFDLMLFQMGRVGMSPPCYHDHALDIAVRETPDRPPLRANDDAFAAMSPGEAMLADRSSAAV